MLILIVLTVKILIPHDMFILKVDISDYNSDEYLAFISTNLLFFCEGKVWLTFLI